MVAFTAGASLGRAVPQVLTIAISPANNNLIEAVRQLAFFVKWGDARPSGSSLAWKRESRVARKYWIPAFAGMTSRSLIWSLS
jgi:hypothetical protein